MPLSNPGSLRTAGASQWHSCLLARRWQTLLPVEAVRRVSQVSKETQICHAMSAKNLRGGCLQGLPFVRAPGEAEATAAALNAAGTVDGVVTRDGDAFLFGSRTVFPKCNLLVSFSGFNTGCIGCRPVRAALAVDLHCAFCRAAAMLLLLVGRPQ